MKLVENIFVKLQGLVAVHENLEIQITSNKTSGVYIRQVSEPRWVQENLETQSTSNNTSGVHICQVLGPRLV